MGARAFHLIERVNFVQGEIALEIGADRGEGSTPFLRHYCETLDVPFISVDVDPDRGADYTMKGEDFLEESSLNVGFAYLDNYDWIYAEIEGESWLDEQKNRYRELGMKLNNDSSRFVHFTQARLLHPKTRRGALVVFDDTWSDGRGYHGKGATAVPFLLSQGWQVELACGEKWEGFYALRRVK